MFQLLAVSQCNAMLKIVNHFFQCLLHALERVKVPRLVLKEAILNVYSLVCDSVKKVGKDKFDLHKSRVHLLPSYSLVLN